MLAFYLANLQNSLCVFLKPATLGDDGKITINKSDSGTNENGTGENGSGTR